MLLNTSAAECQYAGLGDDLKIQLQNFIVAQFIIPCICPDPFTPVVVDDLGGAWACGEGGIARGTEEALGNPEGEGGGTPKCSLSSEGAV
eukprot:scaffold87710_cov16-Tisochrysis_lutea.AAC.2